MKKKLVGKSNSLGNILMGMGEVLTSGAIFDLPTGKSGKLAIYHDEDCRIFEGGRCSCDPEYKLETE